MKKIILISSITLSLFGNPFKCLSQTSIDNLPYIIDTMSIDSVEFYTYLVDKYYPSRFFGEAEWTFNGPWVYTDKNNKLCVIKFFTNEKNEILYQRFVPDQEEDGTMGFMTKPMIDKYMIIYKKSLLENE